MSDYVGGLLHAFTVGETEYFYYVVADVTLWSTDVVDLLSSMLGSPPPFLDALQEALSQAVGGIVGASMSLPALEDILINIPVSIQASVPVTRYGYLQGQAQQYYIVPRNLSLAGISGGVVSMVGVVAEGISIDVLAAWGVLCRYSPKLVSSDWYPIGSGYTVIDFYDGMYDLCLPDSGVINEFRMWYDEPVSFMHYDGQYESAMNCEVVALLRPSGLVPSGSYYYPGATLAFSSGVPSQGGRVVPFLSDYGLDSSSPFSSEIPTDGELFASGLERVWLPQSMAQVRRRRVADYPGAFWGVPGYPVIVRPKKSTIRGKGFSSPVVPVLLALWLLNHRQ